MYTINSRVLIYILLVYFINLYYNMNAKVHKFALKRANNISVNVKEKIQNIYYNKYNIKNQKNIFNQIKMNKIVKEAKTYLGTPYLYGGNSKMGIDCSSFISSVFELQNINLPRISHKQAKKGLPVSNNELQKGDLLFFSTFVGEKKINHVGVVIDIKNKKINIKNNNILFIHASSSNGVTISYIKNPYWKSRFLFARRMT